MATEELWQEKVGFLLLGWALGTISPMIADFIAKGQARRKLKTALRTELEELRYRLAITVHQVNTSLGTINKSTLEWFQQIVARYEGVQKSAKLPEIMAKLSALSDTEISTLAQHGAAPPDVGLSMKTNAAPLLEASLEHISSFNVDLQAQLLQVRAFLSMFNEEVEQSRFYFQLTFDPNITGEARNRVEQCLRDSYKNAASRARVLTEHIGAIKW